MRKNKGGVRAGKWLAAIALAIFNTSPAQAADHSDPTDSNRFSDQPAPLRLEGFPERPAPLLELGDKFLSKGNLQRGYTLPTGAVWSPNFWVYGSLRSAVQSFDPGYAPRTSEWANRLDLYGNLALSPTERILVGFRPVDRNGMSYSGYQFEPNSTRGWNDAFSATPRTLFFEGEFGEIFPKLDKRDSISLDYGFAVGRQPLILQDGLIANDDSIDMVSVTRNALRVPGGSTLRVSGLFAWSQLERNDNTRDPGARMFGLDAAADFPVSTVEASAVYVMSRAHGDGFYAGIGSVQRIGKINTVFRIAQSVAVEQENARVRNGTLLFSELSYTMPYGMDLLYLNGFLGIDDYSSAVRAPTAGGPLGRVGILTAAVGLGRYGAPLSNRAEQAAGGALGYQMFFGELRRRQVIFEIGGRTPLRTPLTLDEEACEGIGARFQQAFGRRTVLVVDAFGVLRNNSQESVGGRVEMLFKF
jgi:hypothetical protein